MSIPEIELTTGPEDPVHQIGRSQLPLHMRIRGDVPAHEERRDKRDDRSSDPPAPRSIQSGWKAVRLAFERR